MKRVLNSLSKKRATSQDNVSQFDDDSPEAIIGKGIRAFCDSGAANNAGEEVLQLPLIVETAESSPTAAKEAANLIRKYLSKENYERPSVQYNAVMLMRILSEHPGRTFTRNLDAKFAVTTKELIRQGRDSSVQQILRETLDTFSRNMALDEGLKPLLEMWNKEKGKMEKLEKFYDVHMLPRPPAPPVPPPFDPHNASNQNYFARNHKSRGLPPPYELAGRVEEAKTSAKLLLQVLQSTPPTEVLGNDLIKEFADRCQSASRSIQGYIHAENPAPDDDTLLTLIETNDQLSLATSKHQRALLQARRELASAAADPSPSPPASIHRPDREIIHQQDDPFNDENGIVAGGLQFPLEPQNYGPPTSVGDNMYTQTSYAPQPSQPRGLGLTTTTPSYARRQETAINDTSMRGADGTSIDEETASISPVETRHPVSYRY